MFRGTGTTHRFSFLCVFFLFYSERVKVNDDRFQLRFHGPVSRTVMFSAHGKISNEKLKEVDLYMGSKNVWLAPREIN